MPKLNVKRAPVISMFIKDLLLFSAYNQEYSVGVSIVQGFVFNKMELEGVVMLVFIIVSVLLLIIPSIMISRQPQSSATLSFSVSYRKDYGIFITCDFKVPALPWIPLFNVWVNIYLMTALEVSIWIKLTVWLGIGYAIYFFYGIRNSRENVTKVPQDGTNEEEIVLTGEQNF